MRNIFLYLSVLLFFFSCQPKDKVNNENNSKDSLVVARVDQKMIYAMGVTLSPQARDFVKNWVAYQQFDTFVLRFYTISKTEALNYAEDLTKMALDLKESLDEELSKKPEVMSRFQVLYSECKRLSDMSKIPAIKKQEVANQVEKVLYAYGAVNSKLNTLVELRDLEKEISLDPDFLAVLNDVPEDVDNQVDKIVVSQKTKFPQEQKPKTILRKSTFSNKNAKSPIRTKTKRNKAPFEEQKPE